MSVEEHHQIADGADLAPQRIAFGTVKGSAAAAGDRLGEHQVQILGVDQKIDLERVVGADGEPRQVPAQVVFEFFVRRANDPGVHEAAIEAARAGSAFGMVVMSIQSSADR